MTSSETSHNGAASTDKDAAAHRAQREGCARNGDLDEVWATIASRVGEIREYALYYVAANLDRLRLSARTALVWSILAIVVGLIAVSIVATAGVIFVVALAAAAGELFGRPWLGQLVVSAVILVAASGSVWLVLRRGLRNYQRTIVQKYELRKAEERSEYGTDVERRAQERAENK